MGRHGGRATMPGPGTGGNPATGTAAIPAEPSIAPLYGPAPTAETVVALANEMCSTFAAAEVARVLAEHATSEAEHAQLSARAAQWDALVNERWPALVEVIRAALPHTGQVEHFMPVRPLTNGHVELHVHDETGRRLVVLHTGAQALAVGAHLTAYGAISLDRIGQKLDPSLPQLKATPPFDPHGTAGQPANPDRVAGPTATPA
ncbi:hypothetical protein ACN27F_03610 [Solwaraspora sp. WMMB335]|uniref:hypothetical protein n=1 Tax=Solwaraspora sp. WMMB335 TaxID=3404118 RepID=UPI003B956BDC